MTTPTDHRAGCQYACCPPIPVLNGLSLDGAGAPQTPVPHAPQTPHSQRLGPLPVRHAVSQIPPFGSAGAPSVMDSNSPSPRTLCLKLVKAPRVPQGAISSIFPSSVNERKGDADNPSGHPWGGERESAKTTGLRLPPPSTACGVGSPARVGEPVHWRVLHPGAGPVDPRKDGGVGDR